MTEKASFSPQTITAPLQTLDDVKKFVAVQQQDEDWSRAHLLADVENVLILLVSKTENIRQILRLCLDAKEEIIAALRLLNKNNTKIYCGYLQDGIGSIVDFGSVAVALGRVQSSQRTLASAYDYFDFKPKKTGRATEITKLTAQQVVFESHGYCMFEGCGANLGIDEVTGIKGNFRYLAHIVASAKDGPRGNEHSHALSNDPTNIMVLCDKHHRLIDKIAVSEYDTIRLMAMKRAFSDNSTKLLQSLAYQPVPMYTVMWAIGDRVTEPPTQQETAISLQPINCRPSGETYRLIERTTEHPLDDDTWAALVPRELAQAKTAFSRLDSCRRKAALYAMGPSGVLIGLGAVLGNKNSLCVVPRLRKEGWGWPRTEPIEPSFTIDGLSMLHAPLGEVAITLFLTDEPAESKSVLDYLSSKDIPSINIRPHQLGNDCIAHHLEGAALRELFLDLLHQLRNSFGIKRVHLLPCAPNAACVEVGRGIEHNHPAVRVYDHCKINDIKYMVPRLDLTPGEEQVIVERVPADEVSGFHQHFQSVSSDSF